MKNLNETQCFGGSVEKEAESEAKKILLTVSEALRENGYNPVNQIVGYILSGDPTYVTSYKNARSGDIIRSKDGYKSIYLGSGLYNGEQVFVYKNSNGLIFSTLRPFEWSRALGSQRNDSTVRVVNKNNK